MKYMLTLVLVALLSISGCSSKTDHVDHKPPQPSFSFSEESGTTISWNNTDGRQPTGPWDKPTYLGACAFMENFLLEVVEKWRKSDDTVPARYIKKGCNMCPAFTLKLDNYDPKKGDANYAVINFVSDAYVVDNNKKMVKIIGTWHASGFGDELVVDKEEDVFPKEKRFIAVDLIWGSDGWRISEYYLGY